jgi:hypothetical protein
VDASLSHRHRWSGATDTWLTAGVSEGRTTIGPLATPSSAAYPIAELGVERRASAWGRVSVRASARLAPIISPLAGLVDERAQVTLGENYQRERFTTAASLSASRSVATSDRSATSLFNGQLGAGYGVTKLVALDAGVRGIWQRQEATGATVSMATLSIGVTLQAPPARL